MTFPLPALLLALLSGAALWPTTTSQAAPSREGGPPPEAPAAGSARYRLRIETSMPNLEENLRYATLNEERCVDPSDLADQFWMTRDSALTDCRLVKTRQDPTAAHYRLACRGNHGAEGSARWTLDGDRLIGVLDLRLGGKNMTVTQRITGERIGNCR